MDTSKVISDVNATTEKLVAILAGFSAQDFNTRPADNTWSAGDIAEHLYLLDTRINHILKEPALAAERPFDHKLNMIETGLLNRTNKYAVPEYIRPAATDKNQQDMINKLQLQRQAQIGIIQSAEVTEMTAARHPMMGSFTRLEWVYFNLYHTQRHIMQLETLKEAIDSLKANG